MHKEKKSQLKYLEILQEKIMIKSICKNLFKVALRTKNTAYCLVNFQSILNTLNKSPYSGVCLPDIW